MAQILIWTAVVAVNVALVVAVCVYVWRRIGEAERISGERGEDRRWADRMYDDHRKR